MSEAKVTSLSLKSLLVPSKQVEAEFPGLPGFKVDISFLSRETLIGLRKKATKTVMKGRLGIQEELNDELFLELYVGATIKGWKGLTLNYLSQLAPVDLEGQDLTAELEYSAENALFLMKASSSFDSWISDQVQDLGNFQKNSKSK